MSTSAPTCSSSHVDAPETATPVVDVWSALEAEMARMPSFWLANTECFEQRNITAEDLPSAGYGPSNGKVLYETVVVDDGNGKKRTVKRLLVGFLGGSVGTVGDGTRLGACGDTWKDIDNKTKVKMCIALKGFDSAEDGQFAENITLDQRVGLDEICAKFYSGGMAEYLKHKSDASITFRPILKIFGNEASWMSDIGGRFSHEVVKIGSHNVYHIDTSGIPILETARPPAIPLARSNRKRKADDTSEDHPEASTSSAGGSAPGPAPAPSFEVTLDSKYSPSVLPGHDDPKIRHTGTVQVNQFDWRREDGSLIPPGDYYRVLVPGTKVLIGASFRRWDVSTKKDGRTITFQAIAETLKVFARAPGPNANDDEFLNSITPASLSDPIADDAPVPTAVADSFHSINLRPTLPSTSSAFMRNPVTPSVSTAPDAMNTASSGDVEMVDRAQPSTNSPKKPKKNNKHW